MIYSPFYRPRYPFSYSRPVNNIYTYSVNRDKKTFENNNKKSECIAHIENHNQESRKATTNNDSQIIEIFRNFFAF